MGKPRTTFLNVRTSEGVETIDQFTQGEDAPLTSAEFRKYVREMVREYHTTGQPVYTSSRCTRDWASS